MPICSPAPGFHVKWKVSVKCGMEWKPSQNLSPVDELQTETWNMQNKNQLCQDRAEGARHLVTPSHVLETHFDFIYFELNWLKFKAKANIPHFLWSEVKCENSVLNSQLDAELRVWSVTECRGLGLLEISAFHWLNLPEELEKLKTRSCREAEDQKISEEDSPQLCELPERRRHSCRSCPGVRGHLWKREHSPSSFRDVRAAAGGVWAQCLPAATTRSTEMPVPVGDSVLRVQCDGQDDALLHKAGCLPLEYQSCKVS